MTFSGNVGILSVTKFLISFHENEWWNNNCFLIHPSIRFFSTDYLVPGYGLDFYLKCIQGIACNFCSFTARLPHLSKVVVLSPISRLGVCVPSLLLHPKNMQLGYLAFFKMTDVFMCPVTDWWPVHGAPSLASHNAWDRLQPPRSG